MRRVVVTGLGGITSLGFTFRETWKNILSGHCGIQTLYFLNNSDIPCKIASRIVRDDENIENNKQPSQILSFMKDKFTNKHWSLSKQDSQYRAHSIQYALAATMEAVQDSQLPLLQRSDIKNNIDHNRIGVSYANSMGGPEIADELCVTLAKKKDIEEKDDGNGKGNRGRGEGGIGKGYRKISPYDLPNALTNTSAGAISARYQLHGPNLCHASACAAGAHAIIQAYDLIVLNRVDVMIAGGTEASIIPWSVGGFSRCKALACKFNDKPMEASRPFDTDRCGFVIGEGAATLVLEEYEHAKQRGATIYAELVGVGSTSDAYHMTAPEPSGEHIRRCMDNCINHASARENIENKIIKDKIGYVNAHATSTPIGDNIELNAILQCLIGNSNNRKEAIQQRLKKNDLKISATKSSIGHLLGAAGAIEACISIQTLVDQIAPPTLNLHHCEEEFEKDGIRDLLCANQSKPFQTKNNSIGCEYSLSNSFGFGGTNASLLFRRIVM